MPATSRSQQRLFCMALAVRKGDLARSKVSKSVLDIVDGDMTNRQIEDFTVLKESGMMSLTQCLRNSLNESILSTTGSGKAAFAEKWLEQHGIKKSDYNINESGIYIQNNTDPLVIEESIPDYINLAFVKTIVFKSAKSLDNFPRECGNCKIVDSDIKDFSFLDSAFPMDKFEVHQCSIKSLKGLPECYTALTISDNEQHYAIKDIAKHTKTNPGKIHNFGHESYTKWKMDAGDVEYCKKVFEAFKKVLRMHVPEFVLIEMSIPFTHDFLKMHFDCLTPDEYMHRIADNSAYFQFIFDVATNALTLQKEGSVCGHTNGTYSSPKLFSEVSGKKWRKVRLDDFSEETLEQKLLPFLKDSIKAAKDFGGGKIIAQK